MFYFYSNGKLISQSSEFSEVFNEFFNTYCFCCLKVWDDVDIVRMDLLSNVVPQLICNSAFWLHTDDGCEFSIMTEYGGRNGCRSLS